MENTNIPSAGMTLIKHNPYLLDRKVPAGEFQFFIDMWAADVLKKGTRMIDLTSDGRRLITAAFTQEARHQADVLKKLARRSEADAGEAW